MTSPDPPPPAEAATTWTILGVLRWTTARFTERGLSSPRLDAELLAAHAFELPRVGLYTQFDRPLGPVELGRFRELVKRRQAGEPVAYLTGRKQFWNLELAVDRRVLVPRPDTETAVEAALELCRPRRPEAAVEAAAADPGSAEGGEEPGSAERGPGPGSAQPGSQSRPAQPRYAPPASAQPLSPPPGSGEPGSERGAEEAATAGPESAVPVSDAAEPAPVAAATAKPAPAGLRIADIGTGSGAIALVLKKELPHAEVLAVDCSIEALEVARGNADRLGLAVTFRQGDLLEPLAGEAPFDLIVANLPYVPSGEIPTLAPEVRSEPLLALDGGADGLALVRRLVGRVAGFLRPGGAVVLEVGMGQADATAEIARAAGLTEVQTRSDLGGILRVVVARRAPGAP